MNWRQAEGGGLGDQQRLCVDEFGHRLKAEVATSHLPFVGDLEQDRSPEPDYRDFVRLKALALSGEDAHHIGTSLHLLVQPLQRVGRVDACPMIPRESHLCGSRSGRAMAHSLYPSQVLLPGDLERSCLLACQVLREPWHGVRGPVLEAPCNPGENEGRHVAETDPQRRAPAPSGSIREGAGVLSVPATVK